MKIVVDFRFDDAKGGNLRQEHLSKSISSVLIPSVGDEVELEVSGSNSRGKVKQRAHTLRGAG